MFIASSLLFDGLHDGIIFVVWHLYQKLLKQLEMQTANAIQDWIYKNRPNAVLSQELKSKLKPNINDTLMHCPEASTTWPGLLSQTAFCQPRKTTLVH